MKHLPPKKWLSLWRCKAYALGFDPFAGMACVLIWTIDSKCERLCANVRGAMETLDPDISTLFDLAEQGDEVSASKLFTLLYGELHPMAKRQLAHQGDISLSATALIHEAYLDMAAQQGHSFPDRGRFMAYAARVMRGLIIDHVRNRLAIKRGGQFELTSLTTNVGDVSSDDRELTRMSHALDDLAQVDNSLSQIVDLKFFCGFSFSEIAGMTGVSERTVQRKSGAVRSTAPAPWKPAAHLFLQAKRTRPRAISRTSSR